MYLDDERTRSLCTQCGGPLNARRDDGDGSSSSTNNEELGVLSSHSPNSGSLPSRISPFMNRSPSRRQIAIEEAIHRHRSIINGAKFIPISIISLDINSVAFIEQVLLYIRSLEKKLQQVENEKKNLLHVIKKDSCKNFGLRINWIINFDRGSNGDQYNIIRI